ncbi:hypothetical protein WJX81_006698 [Elliptochloris bilobata]|uniref:Protein kinase A anchor protein nuclear localisation signal domain-containing protein n=1 Tax=Elliptochloris bilobata TaxID=381761 RepID=A0AAW1R417_9CHLO
MALAALVKLGVGVLLAIGKRRASGSGSEQPELKRQQLCEGTVATIKATATAEDAALPPPPPAVTNMEDSWRAKVTVTLEQQADCGKLAAVYDDMRDAFKHDGLNVAAIRATLQFYSDASEPHPEPLMYAHFPTPLQPGVVRLAVLQPPVTVRAAAHEAADAVAKALVPAGIQPHLTAIDSHHITLFMTSQPGDPRPDAFNAAGGGLDLKAISGSIPAPAPDVLARERAAVRQLAAATPAPDMEVHSLVFASSGALLLCCVDRSGQLAGLRQRMRSTFPGASAKQSTIFHITLLRVLSPQQLAPAQVAAVQVAVDAAAGPLVGLRFTPRHMLYVLERQYTTVEGTREECPFAQPAAGAEQGTAC